MINRLREVRLCRGITIQKVTEGCIRKSMRTFSRYEKGECEISGPDLIRLARFYRVPAEELYVFEEGIDDGYRK